MISYFLNEAGIVGKTVSTEKKHKLEKRKKGESLFSVDASKVKRALFRLCSEAHNNDSIGMITLTFSNHIDEKNHNELISKFLESCKASGRVLSYVWVREARDKNEYGERHENEIHYHVIVRYPEKFSGEVEVINIKYFQRLWSKILTDAGFDVKYQNSVRFGTWDKIKKRRRFFLNKWLISKVAKYLSKYLSKTERNNFRCWACSQDVTPNCIRLNESMYVSFINAFEVEKVKIEDVEMYRIIKWDEILKMFQGNSFETIYDTVIDIAMNRINIDNEINNTVECFEKEKTYLVSLTDNEVQDSFNNLIDICMPDVQFENKKEYEVYHSIAF